ncbi:hypothetical protein PI124_g19816 [Phytophthora idaei]|nr:hypothetical protein PI124_g19816 [Phytophthora idaei]
MMRRRGRGLKAALMRRYGERPDQAMAEWRVYQRMMYPEETFAEFAAGLRDLTGQNHDPVLTTQAVDKATAIDYPIDIVAQGMLNIGQAWVTASNAFSVAMRRSLCVH